MLEFLRNIKNSDPAKPSLLEVALCYPGVHAMFFYRIANYLYKLKLPIIPRFISNFASILTGIEIHPGATIGKRLFIDHGTGVVIGQEAIIGDDVLIYHGVTLGGSGKIKSGRRHPKIGNNVVLGAGATLIGNINVGDGTKIGPNAIVVKDVGEKKVMVGATSKERTKESYDIEYFI